MTRDDVEDVYELSPLQHGILAHELSSPGSRLYVVTVRVPLDGADPDALRAAWSGVVRATPALRTSVHWEAIDKPLQVVHRDVEVPLSFLHAPRTSPITFDLARAPLFCVDVVSDGSGHELRWTYHHILLDGWSAGLVLQDLAAAYRRVRGQPVPPAPLRRSFAEYLSWMQGRPAAEADRYWRDAVVGVSEPTRLPAGNGAGRITVPVSIPAAIVSKLRVVATEAGLTMASIVTGAWALLLHRYSGERQVLFGVTVSGRGAPLEGIDEMIGMFINTVPFVADVDGGSRAIAWLTRLQEGLVVLREHEHTSPADIRRAVRFAPGRPLFESVVVFERFTSQVRSAASDGEAGTDLPMSLCLAETTDDLSGSVTFDASRVSETFARNIPGHMHVLLEALAARPNIMLRDLPVLTIEEQRRILSFNDTAVSAEPASSIHELFFAQSARTPEAVAIVAGDLACTYRDVAAAAIRLAHRLRLAGVGPESRVGLCAQRTPEMVAAMYGILAAGGAYVPLDPAYPEERIRFIAADAGLTHLVGNAAGLPELPMVVCHELEPVAGEHELPAAPPTTSSPDHLAYVLYTSGSTGRPKGVALLHRGACVLMQWARATYLDDELHGVLASTSINFDCSIFEIFAPLSWGGYIVLAKSSVEIPPIAAPHEIRLASMVPSNLLTQVRNGTLPPGLRGVNLGGEASPRELVELLAAQHRALEIFHVYGPTEDTTYTTCARLHLAHGDVMPIGRPLPGTSVYLLDGEGRLVPEGCIGDVHIAGLGLARGYLDRPDLTADRFVPDHLSGAPGSRLYRTGDLGRMRPDGEIELLGRRDQQVKLRGYRVELGEIEAVLGGHADVAEAVCVLRTADDGERTLAAFVTSRPGSTVDAGQLRAWLASRLPGALVPSRIVPLPELPRNPNGKVDRRALPDPALFGAAMPATGEPPRDRVELELARIWEEILAVPSVSRDVTFAELGGHSLHVVSILSRVLRTTGVRLPFTALRESATVASLARELAEQRPVSPGPLVTLAGRGEGAPLFLVHAALGGVLAYDELVRHLGGAAPIFAFQAPGLDDGAAPLESIAGLASRYLEELERVCPSGPVVVGGWSFGAIVAHEMARRLRAAGRTAQLVLLDPTPPPTGDGEALADETLRLAFVEHLGRPNADVADPVLAPIYQVFCSNMRALGRHAPAMLPGNALLVTARERWQEPATTISAAWREHIEALTARDVPGDHLTMLRAPHVAALAQVLRDQLLG